MDLILSVFLPSLETVIKIYYWAFIIGYWLMSLILVVLVISGVWKLVLWLNGVDLSDLG